MDHDISPTHQIPTVYLDPTVNSSSPPDLISTVQTRMDDREVVFSLRRSQVAATPPPHDTTRRGTRHPWIPRTDTAIYRV
jgi:hypothetical protein